MPEQWQEQIRDLQARASRDPELRQALRARPMETLTAHGISVPQNLGVEVREVAAGDREAQFAAAGPSAGGGGELGEDILANVAGGFLVIIIVR